MAGTSVVSWVFAGMLTGIAAAAPLELAARRVAAGRAGIGVGLAAVVASFVLLHIALLAVWLVRREAVLPYGTAAALAFLAVTVVRALLVRPR